MTTRKLDAQQRSENMPVAAVLMAIMLLIFCVLITAPIWVSWLNATRDAATIGGLL